MLDTTATNVQVLSAMDFGAAYGRTPDLDALVADLGDALLRTITHEVPHWRDGHAVTEHLLVFDAGRLRNTEAHGMGYRRGFVVCIRQPGDVQVALDAADAAGALDEAAAETLAQAAANLPAARKAVAEARRSARQGFGCIYVTISLPRPWGAANVYADGRVLAPSTGLPITELA